MPMKSLVNAAYDVLTKKYANDGNKSVPMPFGELLAQVGEELGINSEAELLKICSRFYTDLTLDGRFVIKENNTWVLREHELFENVHIDMNDVYSLDEYIDEDDEAKEKANSDEDDDGIERKPHDDDEEEELGEESNDSLSMGEDEDDND